MGKYEKLLEKIMAGHYNNIDFDELCNLVENIGFKLLRIEGSHHIFHNKNINAYICLQPDGHNAKFYQVKQIKKIITQHNLNLGDDNNV